MKQKLAVIITSIVLVLLALMVGLLPFALGHLELLSAKWLLEPLIVLAAAGFLFKGKKIAIFLLSISALQYLCSGFYEAYSLGLSPSVLRAAFWWAFAVRLLFVVWVVYLLSHPNSANLSFKRDCGLALKK